MIHREIYYFAVLIIVLTMITYIIMMSKNSYKKDNDLELTERTMKIIDLYIETTDDTDDPIYICGSSIDNTYAIKIFAYDPSPDIFFDGWYNGDTYYRERTIEVWGDSWNGLFWKQKHKPIYVAQKQVEQSDSILTASCFDPCYWYLTIDKNDTTILNKYCEFFCDIDFSIDTFNTLLK